jgi:hypothetical protein
VVHCQERHKAVGVLKELWGFKKGTEGEEGGKNGKGRKEKKERAKGGG